MMSRLSLVVRLAARDLRGGLRGFRIFLACVCIGVAAIVGVDAVANSLLTSFARQGRVLLGGDIAFSRSQRPLDSDERDWLSSRGRVSEIATLRATASTAVDASTVELKAIDSSYPLTGALDVDPRLPIAGALESIGGPHGALADVALMDRLALKVGDRFRIAAGDFELRGQIRSEPDRIATGVGFGPRVIISKGGLAAAGLSNAASLIRWTARVALPETASQDSIESLAKDAIAKFPTSGWDVRTRSNVSPQLTRNVERFSQFMALIGVVSLIAGGIGIAGAVVAFVDRKRESIAVLKAIGASGSLIFQTLFLEMMAIAMLGSLGGALVGALIPLLAGGPIGSALDLPFEPVVAPGSLFAGILTGLLVSAAFVAAPVGRAHETPVATLFRLATSETRGRLRARYAVLAVCCFAALVLFVAVSSSERKIALAAMAGVLLSGIILRVVAFGISRAAALAPDGPRLSLRLALRNIRRPGAVTTPVVTSLGLGLTLLVAIVAVDGNIRRQLAQGQPGRTPDFFFVDVQSSQADAFRAFIAQRRPGDRIEAVPMLRGRIVRIGERRSEEVKADSNAAWVLEGDRGITYSARPPEGSQVVEGEWWPADYAGPPLVSMDADIARGLGLKIGDSIAVNVAGRIIAARLSNLRRVDWRSFGINFVLVFSPSTFAGAPHSELFALTPPDGVARQDAALVRDVARAYPGVTALGVEALDQALTLVGKLSAAVRAASAVTISTALLVLGGALAAGMRKRLYDAMILRTLGAARGLLIRAFLLEFLALGVATSLFAILAGGLAAWLVVTRLMSLDFHLEAGPVLAVAGLGCATTVALGLVATWRVLGEKPARTLREL
mgnify:CR=1 FL=1